MSKFGFDKLKKGLENAASFNIKDAVNKSTDLLKESVQNLQEMEVSNSLQILGEKGGEVINSLKEKKDISRDKIKEALLKQDDNDKELSVYSGLKLMYCLIAADGQFLEEEENMFEEIGMDMDPRFLSYKEIIKEEFQNSVAEAEDKNEYADDLRRMVTTTLNESTNYTEVTVKVKLLLWNLYSVAYCDNDYSDEEIGLISYIGRSLGINKSVISEMNEDVKTIFAIDQEINWVKSSDRPYLVIEEEVKELEHRKQVIMASVYALIAD